VNTAEELMFQASTTMGKNMEVKKYLPSTFAFL
jgi:hypothetical protein